MHRAAILSVLAAVAISSVASDHEVHETVTKIGVDHPAVASAQAALPGADFCFGYLESKVEEGKEQIEFEVFFMKDATYYRCEALTYLSLPALSLFASLCQGRGGEGRFGGR